MGLIWVETYPIRSKNMKILMLGLDGAGKTTILNQLKYNKYITTSSTVGFNFEEILYNEITLCIWDIGGNETLRPLWHHYFKDTQGLIFVIDSTDHQRLNEACNTLTNLLKEDILNNVPLLIYLNKQDSTDAIKPNELENMLELKENTDKAWKVQGCCAIKGDELKDGIEWLFEHCTCG